MNYKRQFISFLLATFIVSLIAAQEFDAGKKLPVDEHVKIGKLENGFTYYIRQNQKPERRVEMRLVVNAGSSFEDDDQQGLAHFIEHMAFNGSTHFEKNELKNYLESIGIRFGPELNAYTSFDETVYMLTIPSDSMELLEKGFLVMEDWAHGLTLTDEEIDKERGVIIEEWRIGQGWAQRMRDKFWPLLFAGSRYEVRLPIGKKEIIEGCSYETLRRFYHDWYRPGLMALIVVGDIDPGFAEQKIISHFEGLSDPENPRPWKSYDIPDQEGTSAMTITDPEAPYNIVRVIIKDDVMESKTYGDYLEALKFRFVTGILNRRLMELTEKENPPFIASSFYYGGLAARTKNALQGYVLAAEGSIEKAMGALLTELQRVDLYGFTDQEFERYKLEVLKLYENLYNERDKTESSDFVEEYTRNFLEDETIPGIDFEYMFVKENLNRIQLSEINTLAQELISDENRAIIVQAPEKEGVALPDEQQILALAKAVESEKIEPYLEDKVADQLMLTKPKAGKIKKEKQLKSIEATELILSNGARVILKPTDYKNDEVLLTAFSMGGHSQYSDDDHFSAINADGIVQESGSGGFSKSDISKILAGKSVYVAPAITYNSEIMSAQAKSSDLESMFQLMYLYFTDPRIDQSAFNSYMQKKRDLFENLSKEPQNYFYDKFYRILSQDHPRGDYLPLSEDWDKVDFQRAMEIYKDRFADAGNFTFVMVGAFDVETVRPLLETYVASLPTLDRKEAPVDLGMRPPYESKVEKIYKGNDPKSTAIIYFEKEVPGWNEKDAYLISVLSNILTIKYVDVLREEMSGVYGVRSSASYSKIPYEHTVFQVMIPCAPENVDGLVEAAIGELKKIQEEGVDEANLQKVREAKKRALETNLQKNDYWLKQLENSVTMGTDFKSITNDLYMKFITSDEIQRVANKYFDSDRYLKVVLYPENEE
ncbi:MAG: insulinase family protein [Bacteroidales bacterium]|nr:insulinase family protein [Bacteroidales bacterium]